MEPLLKTRVVTGLAYLRQCQEYPLYALLDFWKFDLCILSMMNIFSIIWSLCAVQSCQKKHVPIWPLWCQKFLPFCTSVPLFHPHTNLWWLFFFSFHFFHFFKYCGFIFLCQRLFFKGKVSDTVVWHHVKRRKKRRIVLGIYRILLPSFLSCESGRNTVGAHMFRRCDLPDRCNSSMYCK